MKISKKLQEIADKLIQYKNNNIEPLYKLKSNIEDVDKSFSGSWLGYHSKVYYKDFISCPSSATFSTMSGLDNNIYRETIGDWVEYQYDEVTNYILEKSDNIQLSSFKEDSIKVTETFDLCKSDVLSIIYANKKNIEEDEFFNRLLTEIEYLSIFTGGQYLHKIQPHRISSHDMRALSEGIKIPPHINMLLDCMDIISPYLACDELYDSLTKLIKHIKEKEEMVLSKDRNYGTKIFIGHGQPSIWRELKDFIQDSLQLPCDEFNKDVVAGKTITERLTEMLDSACMAFIIMTAEDETKDGEKQARMNVIHEIGLFQGRLGFNKTIILLEEGCKKFSNIEGLVYVPFSKGKIKETFEGIREVLKREGIIK